MKRIKIISSITLEVLLLTIAFGCKKKDSDSYSQYTIGQSYGGGIVFYSDGTGEHGLVRHRVTNLLAENGVVWEHQFRVL